MHVSIRPFVFTGIAIFASIGSTSAEAHVHFDPSPYLPVGGDKIVVDGLTHGTDENPFTGLPGPTGARYLNPGQRVFELEFELDSGFVYAGDPGLARDAASAIDPDGNTVSANSTNLRPTAGDQIFVRLTRDLLRWDGDSFDPILTGETLSMDIPGPGVTLVAGTGLTTESGPRALPWSTGDQLHTHAETYLYDGLGGGNPAAGIYLLSLQFESSVAGVLPSDEIFFVWNWNDTEENHEAGVEYVESNLVPEPTSLAAIGLGALGLLRRKRRA